MKIAADYEIESRTYTDKDHVSRNQPIIARYTFFTLLPNAALQSVELDLESPIKSLVVPSFAHQDDDHNNECDNEHAADNTDNDRPPTGNGTVRVMRRRHVS